MESRLLKDVIARWRNFDIEDNLYVAPGDPLGADTLVVIHPASERPKPSGLSYFIGVEQIRDVVEGLSADLGRAPTEDEAVRAVIHYAEFDAPIHLADPASS
jgi:hypothetical protein